MLRELRIRNFAIIDELSVDFQPGLNVLTGETGAGKSIIVDALGIALGERAYVEMIKTGKTEAMVEAFFDITRNPVVEGLGIDSSEGLILRRNITASGKGRAYVNDTMVNVQSLLEIGKTLVDIHGQHEHQSLLTKENHLRLIDHYGRLDDERDKLEALFDDVRSLKRKLENIRRTERERTQRQDILMFQINEINSAALTEKEDSKLEEEKNILKNLTRLNELVETSYSLLYGEEGSCLEKLSSALSKIREISHIDSSISDQLKTIEDAVPLIEDAAVSLRKYTDIYNIDPGRLSLVEDRIEQIKTLKRKYGDTIEAIFGYKEDAVRELSAIEMMDEEIEKTESGLVSKEKKLHETASSLSEKRKIASKDIESSINALLGELALEKSEFRVEIRQSPLTGRGVDDIEFLFSANPGEAPKPLSKVVSGGELSRIMLAIKSFLRDIDDIPVLIFDEVDAGIGGKTADNVAVKLKTVSGGRQVICITHLPQIAALADSHLLIEKSQKKNGVCVKVKALSGIEKQEEIARMLSGKLTEVSLRHAREMIESKR